MPLIKRYPNRKLYDTEAKHYVSLDDIAELIRQGIEVQVVEHATGEDVTTLVLTQVIVEQEKKRSGFLPQSVLASLVQAGGETVTGLRRALTTPLELLHQVDEEIERRIQGLVRTGELDEAEGQRLSGLLTAWGHRAHELVQPTREEIKRWLQSHRIATASDVEDLRQQVEALEAELERLSREQEG